jgi:4-hydroxyphenylpyruvate dioxygenase
MAGGNGELTTEARMDVNSSSGATDRQATTGRAEPGGCLRGRRSIATVSLSGSLKEKLAAAAQAGFNGIELLADDLDSCRIPARDVRLQTEDLGLKLMLYQPLRDVEAAPPEEFAANLRRAKRTFDLMTELGTRMLLVCSSTAPAAIDDDGYAAAQLRQLACLAAGYGIRVAYEALSWGACVNTYRHAWQLVAAAAHENLGICLDSFHILALGHDTSAIRDLPADKIFFVQLADAPHLKNVDLKTWSRNYRCFPGRGELGLAGFAADVLATGYAGPWSLEIFNPALRQTAPGELAAAAMKSLLGLEGLLPGAWHVHRNVDMSGLTRHSEPTVPRMLGSDKVQLSEVDRSCISSARGAIAIAY